MRVFYRLLAFIGCFCVVAGLYGQQTARVSGISFSYVVQDGLLNCSLRAPTKGWIGVGFNFENSIVGSDLLLFNIVNGKVSSTDLFVKGAGNPVRDVDNSGKNSITVLGGNESGAYTEVAFTIPMDSGDPNDFIHKLGQEVWLILAYSIDDDFGHHSRVRKHIPFKIETP